MQGNIFMPYPGVFTPGYYEHKLETALDKFKIIYAQNERGGCAVRMISVTFQRASFFSELASFAPQRSRLFQTVRRFLLA